MFSADAVGLVKPCEIPPLYGLVHLGDFLSAASPSYIEDTIS